MNPYWAWCESRQPGDLVRSHAWGWSWAGGRLARVLDRKAIQHPDAPSGIAYKLQPLEHDGGPQNPKVVDSHWINEPSHWDKEAYR